MVGRGDFFRTVGRKRDGGDGAVGLSGWRRACCLCSVLWDWVGRWRLGVCLGVEFGVDLPEVLVGDVGVDLGG